MACTGVPIFFSQDMFQFSRKFESLLSLVFVMSRVNLLCPGLVCLGLVMAPSGDIVLYKITELCSHRGITLIKLVNLEYFIC